jgi:phosphoesterase RecJ-like protein
MILSRKIQEQFDLREGESEGLVNVPLSIEKVRLSVLVKEDGPFWRVSIRSKKGTSAQKLAQLCFHGGGHENAAGGKIIPGQDFARSRGLRSYLERILNDYLS